MQRDNCTYKQTRDKASRKSKRPSRQIGKKREKVQNKGILERKSRENNCKKFTREISQENFLELKDMSHQVLKTQCVPTVLSIDPYQGTQKTISTSFQRERETKLHTSGFGFFLTVILEARRQESKPFKVLKEKISTIFYPPSYQLKQYFQVCKILFISHMHFSRGFWKMSLQQNQRKKTNIWHIGIQGGTDPRKERGKGNTRNVSSASDLRTVSPETNIEGCPVPRFLLLLCQQTA